MPLIMFFASLFQKIGIPGCVVLVCAISATGALTAEKRYAKHTDFQQIAKRQIAQSIREVHNHWCKTSKEQKTYWWQQLQTYQDEYKFVSDNGRYELPPCPGV